jgi:hypothetical protein
LGSQGGQKKVARVVGVARMAWLVKMAMVARVIRVA